MSLNGEEGLSYASDSEPLIVQTGGAEYRVARVPDVAGSRLKSTDRDSRVSPEQVCRRLVLVAGA